MSAARERCLVEPVPGVDRIEPYRLRRPADVRLQLDMNEGPAAPPQLAARVADAAREVERLRRYPTTEALEARLARRVDAEPGIDPACIVVTNGGDDAIDRITRAVLAPGRAAALAVPTFEMIERGVDLRGADRRAIEWPGGPLPTEALLAAGRGASLVAVVSPCNPTGAVADVADLLRLADELPETVLLADLAYVEFADHDPTAELLSRPNVVVVRTFSKFLGLAGLRIGWAACGDARVARWLRAVGGPFPVSSVSLAAAEAVLDLEPAVLAARRTLIAAERGDIASRLRAGGFDVPSSQANFVLARGPGATALRSRLARRGILIRGWDPEGPRADWVRISCPGDESDQAFLLAALDDVLERDAPGRVEDAGGDPLSAPSMTVDRSSEPAAASTAARETRP